MSKRLMWKSIYSTYFVSEPSFTIPQSINRCYSNVETACGIVWEAMMWSGSVAEQWAWILIRWCLWVVIRTQATHPTRWQPPAESIYHSIFSISMNRLPFLPDILLRNTNSSEAQSIFWRAPEEEEKLVKTSNQIKSVNSRFDLDVNKYLFHREFNSIRAWNRINIYKAPWVFDVMRCCTFSPRYISSIGAFLKIISAALEWLQRLELDCSINKYLLSFVGCICALVIHFAALLCSILLPTCHPIAIYLQACSCEFFIARFTRR
jgi:hypothetical protein